MGKPEENQRKMVVEWGFDGDFGGNEPYMVDIQLIYASYIYIQHIYIYIHTYILYIRINIYEYFDIY